MEERKKGKFWMKKRDKIRIITVSIWISVMLSGMTVYAEEYEYDELNRVTKVIYEDGSTVEYEYDRNGNITEVIVVDTSPEEEEKPASTEEETEEERTTDTEPEESSEDVTEDAGESEETEETENNGIVEAIIDIIEKVIKWFISLFS